MVYTQSKFSEVPPSFAGCVALFVQWTNCLKQRTVSTGNVDSRNFFEKFNLLGLFNKRIKEQQLTVSKTTAHMLSKPHAAHFHFMI